MNSWIPPSHPLTSGSSVRSWLCRWLLCRTSAEARGSLGLLLSWGKTVTSALQTHTLVCTFMQRKACASMQTSMDGPQRQIWSCRNAYRITRTKTLHKRVSSLAVPCPSAATATIIKTSWCQKRTALTPDPRLLISGLQTGEWQLRPRWPSFDSSGFLVSQPALQEDRNG